MKNITKRILCLLFVTVLCCSFNSTAWAKENAVVRLTAVVELEGALPEQEDEYAIILTNSDTGEQYCSTIKGDGEVSLERLTFDDVGIYQFTIEQATGGNKQCTYDNSVYRAKITVTYADDGSYNISVAVRKDGDNEKQDCILFKNTYDNDEPYVPIEPVTEETTTHEHENTTQAHETTTQEETTYKWDSTNPENPNTGDNTKLSLGLVLFAMGIITVVGFVVFIVPRKKQQEE